ncbi:MAG: crossover junction endodeoxyribonuclease RuvC [Candidatus Heimdallarchaeaceae archaeon]
MAKKLGVIKEKEVEVEEPQCKERRDPMFVGIDPSFNGFGIIVLDKDANIVEQKLIASNTKDEIEDRLMYLEAEYGFIPNIMCLQSVYLEGPAFLANGKFALQMGALHFMIRLMLKKRGVGFKVIAPGTLKKFVTGKGNAKKDLMLLNVYKKWGVEFDNDNLADAYGMARMALEDYKNEQTG